MALARFTLREVLQRPLRALLTLLSIVIGVAAIVAVTIATQTTTSAHRAVFETVTGKAALEITAEDNRPFDESLLAEVEGTAGLAAAVPLLEGKAAIYAEGRGGEGIDAQVLGIDLGRHVGGDAGGDGDG